jgi:hypothetical protein
VEHAFLQCPFAREVRRLVKATFCLSLARRDFYVAQATVVQFSLESDGVGGYGSGIFGMPETMQGIINRIPSQGKRVT